MCVAKSLNVLRNDSLFRYFAISQNVSFRLFCGKQGCETNDTFREAATFFSCFTVLRHRNQLFRQKPLSSGVKLTAASFFWNFRERLSILLFRKMFRNMYLWNLLRNGCKMDSKWMWYKQKNSRNDCSFRLYLCLPNSNKPFCQKPHLCVLLIQIKFVRDTPLHIFHQGK